MCVTILFKSIHTYINAHIYKYKLLYLCNYINTNNEYTNNTFKLKTLIF